MDTLGRDCPECELLAAGFTMHEVGGVEVWTRPAEPVQPLPVRRAHECTRWCTLVVLGLPVLVGLGTAAVLGLLW